MLLLKGCFPDILLFLIIYLNGQVAAHGFGEYFKFDIFKITSEIIILVKLLWNRCLSFAKLLFDVLYFCCHIHYTFYITTPDSIFSKPVVEW